jgi:hypothetical protein
MLRIPILHSCNKNDDMEHALQGAVQVRGRAEDRVPRGARLEPQLPGGAGEVRRGRQRRRADGPQGEGVAGVGADAALVGHHLEDGHAQGAQGPLLHPPHQRVRREARRHRRGPGELDPQHSLRVQHPVLDFYTTDRACAVS